MKLANNQPVPKFTVDDIAGNQIELLKLRGKKVYLTFLRNTACPLCSFHMYRLLKMADALRTNNMELIAFYESSKKVILSSPFFSDQVLKEKKITVVSDPTRKIYSLFGTEINSAKATLDILERNGRMQTVKEAARVGFLGNGIEEGTHADAVPADFLVDENQVLRYVHYGIDSGDNMSLDVVQQFANAIY